MEVKSVKLDKDCAELLKEVRLLILSAKPTIKITDNLAIKKALVFYVKIRGG